MRVVTPLTKTERLADPFITAGDRAYLIGAQDGGFPEMGWHVPGEMGGLWAHPIKLLDGFWLQVDGRWLTGAHRFSVGTFWSAHLYSLPSDLEVTRSQFAPDGEPAIVVRYAFRSPSSRVLALRFLVRTDLLPVWLAESLGLADGDDCASYASDRQAWICQDSRNPWCVVVGARHLEPVGYQSGHDLRGPEVFAGRGISVIMDYQLPILAGRETDLELVLAGSHLGVEPAVQTFEHVRTRAPDLWRARQSRYDAILSRSVLEIPDPPITAAWDWLKCNYDWLVRHVEGLGRGLGAGVPHYPWWFGCDNSYSLLGCLALGQHDVAVDTLDLLRRVSLAASPDTCRMVHECTTSGYTAHPGCTQETPHFVTAVWHTVRWTGDRAFLRRNYEFCKRGLLEWTLGEQCPDGDLLPYGYGIVEIPHLDLQCVDVAVHTVTALAALADMAQVMGEEDVRLRCVHLYDRARIRLDEMFWMEAEGLYGDLLATPQEILPRLQGWLADAEKPGAPGTSKEETIIALQALLREAEADPHPDRKRPWLCKNWTLICPLEAGLATRERAVRALERLEGPEFTSRWGVYVSGLYRSDIMSINTGALAVAELAYRRADRGLDLIRLIAETLPLHMPGAISEVSPDQGCFVQAWSGYSVVWPLVTQVFGVQPDAPRRRLVLDPCFPASWRRASLRSVKIGDASFDFEWDGERLTVACSEPGWTVLSSDSAVQVVHGRPGQCPSVERSRRWTPGF